MLVAEGMGHINFAQEMIDRKGITERASLDGMTLMNWQVCNPFPPDDAFLNKVHYNQPPSSKASVRRDVFPRHHSVGQRRRHLHRSCRHYQKGVVWVNGHNLGRYWNVGPQQHLYCPAPWLRKGANEIPILDLLQTEPAPVSGVPDL